MRHYIRTTLAVLVLVLSASSCTTVEARATDDSFRVLSWNISGNAPIEEQAEFSSLLRWGNPDVVLLDEVSPKTSEQELTNSLNALNSGGNETWTVNTSVSGGRQRCTVASRAPQESVPEFSSIIPYPDADKQYLQERMSERDRSYAYYSMEGGIPVNAAIILDGDRRLLTVIVDLQCCGDDQSSWEEYRRRVEAREIRRLIERVIKRTSVDGIIIAGDFNLVNGPMPLVLLGGPYSTDHGSLISAEIYHKDNSTSWTWDGRGTPFPSGTLDFQLYGAEKLVMHSGFILETENLPPETLRQHGLENDTSAQTGRHRPLAVEYVWK